MAKLLDNRGTTSNIFQIGSENAVKSADNALEVVSSQFPAERRDFRANTATFEGLVLPNALLNATDNRFNKNPISNGYELVNSEERVTISVDQATGTVESTNGFGIKQSGYVSNAILGFKAPASVSGMVVTMPAGFNINYSDGRDVYDETTNPTGKGVLKSYNSITDTAYTVTVAPTGDDATVSCYVLYDDTVKELFYVNKDQLYYGIKVPAVADGYTVRRDSNGNEYYRLVDGAWVKRHLMRVASFDLTEGKTLENFEPCYPCDLLKLTDYLVADSGGSGSGQKGVIRSMEIPASTTETTSIALDYACEDKNAMLVLIEHTVVPPTTYELSANGKTLTFNTPIPAGMRIDLRWFSSIDVIKVDVPLASDTEFMQGTSDALAPTVKQVHQYNGTKLPLFYPSRFPWVANNIEWLRADTFSWQSGEVYSAAYAELVSIYNAEGGSNETETIGAYTIAYKRCANGMKIADASQQNVIMDIYAATGSAFYFILDLENTRFKLPRTKYSLVGYEDGLGNYVSSEAATGNGVKVAGNQSYLYFYMGTYNQSAIDNTAGLNTELFAGKADVDLSNLSDAGKGRLGAGLELMDIGFAPLGIDESKNKRRYLNGQVIIQEQFPAFTAAVKARMTTMANAFTTEENWQAEKTNSKLGQCGKFVVDDTAGTIRLPCVVNAQGLADLALIGGIKSESLPNFQFKFPLPRPNNDIGSSNFENVETSLGESGDYGTITNTSGYPPLNVTIKGSNSSSTYQDNAPVQQEAVQYPYYIQVATGIEETLPAIREYKVNNSDYFGKSMYSDIAPDNASWLASNGTYNARSVYPDYYDWLNSKVGQVITANGGKVVLSTDTITDYDFVINQNDQTFRLPLLNGDRVLVKKYVSGTDWYNLYSDGWLEQGGETSLSYSNATVTITLLKPYKNTNYNIGFSLGGHADAGVVQSNWQSKTNNNFVIYGDYTTSTVTAPTNWFTCGYAEIPTQSEFTEVSGLYYYVGDTVQDASLINAGAVLGQLSDKISRTATSDKELVVGWGMPDYSSGVDLSSVFVGGSRTYTAPVKGFFIGSWHLANAAITVKVNGLSVGYEVAAPNESNSVSVCLKLDAGDVLTASGNPSGNTGIFNFFPLKGN